jgi:hypothetical protein
MPGGMSTKAQSSPRSTPERDDATNRPGLCDVWNLDLRVWLSLSCLEILPGFDKSLVPSIEEVFVVVVVACDEDVTEEALARTS